MFYGHQYALISISVALPKYIDWKRHIYKYNGNIGKLRWKAGACISRKAICVLICFYLDYVQKAIYIGFRCTPRPRFFVFIVKKSKRKVATHLHGYISIFATAWWSNG